MQCLARGSGFRVDDVRCSAARSGWSKPEHLSGYALVFTRIGYFQRRANGVETLVDANLIYLRAPADEQQIAHPAGCGDRCTSIGLEESALTSVLGDAPEGLPAAVFSTPQLDLAHRSLLLSCHAGPEGNEVDEIVYNLVAAVLGRHDRTPVDSGRSASAGERRRLVSDARALLAEHPARTFSELAWELAVSPAHLSRIFTAATGSSVTTYRRRLRARVVLERLADGERSLARLAAELGFSDHAHLTRTIRSEIGITPSAYRRIWNSVGAHRT